jgi:hypothetical protein
MFARETSFNRYTLIVAAASVAILVVLWRPAAPSPKLVSRWQPQPMLTQPDQPQHLENPPVPASIEAEAQPLTGAGAGFDLSVDDGLYPSERDALAAELQQALEYVARRFGGGPSSRFQAALVADGGCGLHGLAYTDVRQVQTFTCNDIPRARAVAIMAHEFAHQLEQDRYGPAHLGADLILSEGTATWAAGEYWLSGAPDFRTFVRNQRAAGVHYPLATHYSGLGIGAMNALYYEWASFVDFLIATYGRAKFDQLYVSGGGAPGSADYAGVYGKSLDALEQEWLAWLDG